eukprot:1052744-Pelagomonas_calceolata.AAC.1
MALKTSLAPESTFQDDGSIFGLSDVSSTSMSNSPREVELGERLGEKPATEGRRAPRKTSSWRSSTGSLAKQRAMTRHLAKKYWEKVCGISAHTVLAWQARPSVPEIRH